jgi:anti-sigma factor RsiW
MEKPHDTPHDAHGELMHDRINAAVDGQLPAARRTELEALSGRRSRIARDTLAAWQAQREVPARLAPPAAGRSHSGCPAGRSTPGRGRQAPDRPVVALGRHGGRRGAGVWDGLAVAWPNRQRHGSWAARHAVFPVLSVVCPSGLAGTRRVLARGAPSCGGHGRAARPSGAVAVQTRRVGR